MFEPTGQPRTVPFDVAPLAQLIARNRSDLVEFIVGIFQQGWPSIDAEVTTEAARAAHLDGMANDLAVVLKRLRRRLLWAFREVQRLDRKRDEEATLDHEDEAHFRRCDRFLMHQSQISDEEEFRFQMSVATYGREQGRHNGGTMLG